MDSIIQGKSKSIIDMNSWDKKDVLRIVITDATTEVARTLIYRIFTDNVFGENQLLFVSFYEIEHKAKFLKSIAIELTSFGPNLLYGVSYSHDASIAFKDADVIICIGLGRGYDFTEEDYSDQFFKKYVLTSKFYGEAIEKYAKRNAKVIAVGIVAATIISQFTKSIPSKNITALSMFNSNIVTAHIAAQAKCLPTEIKNIIIWGSNNECVFPDCRYMYLTKQMALTNSLKVWLRNSLPSIIKTISNRPNYVRSMAYALAEHCKILWHGTPENQWISMGVLSDHSYGIRAGIFFSYPVYCKNKEYEIVQGLVNDKYVEKCILHLSKLITKHMYAAFQVCDLTLSGNI